MNAHGTAGWRRVGKGASCLAGLSLLLAAGAFGATVEVSAPTAPTRNYPLASGASGLRSASSNSINVEYLLEDVEVGGEFATEETPWHIGDFLSAADQPADVDWAATAAAIEASDALRGKVKVYRSSPDVGKRLLFISGGTTVAIPWHLETGGVQTNHYYVGKVVAERPHRIFWTEGGSSDRPYKAPTISLSGKYVEILGEKGVINYLEGEPTNGVVTVVRGVYYDAQSSTLHAKADEDGNGPRGQFVIAYYDTADRKLLIGVTVVEALPSDPQRANAFVGDRLLPTGGGYSTEGLTPIPQSGHVKTDSSDPDGSPWIAPFTASSPYHPENGAYFAQSPTGTNGAQIAIICWESVDEMKTLWPFELDSYEIAWNPDSPKMVVQDGVDTELLVPTNYATVALGDYMVDADGRPAEIAKLGGDDDRTVTVTSPGWFSLHVTDLTDTYRLTVHVVTNGDPSVSVEDPRTVDVGERLAPFAADTFPDGEAMGAYAALFDPDAEGFICTDASAPVWNPRLYHAPKGVSTAGMIAGTDDDDPFAALRSSIHLVSETKPGESVEVWWHRAVTADEGGKPLPAEISIPGFVNRYAAEMKTSGHRQIALTSQLGSRMPTAGNGGSALYFGVDGFSAAAQGSGLGAVHNRIFAPDEPFAVGLWVNLSPAEMARPACRAGTLVTVGFAIDATGSHGELSLVLQGGGGAGHAVGARLVCGAGTPMASDVLTVPAGEWTHLAVSVGPAESILGTTIRRIEIFRDGGKVGALTLPAGELSVEKIALGGAMGWAADELTVWDSSVGPDELAALWANDGRGRARDLAARELVRFAMGELRDVAVGAGVANAYGRFILAQENPRATERGYLALSAVPPRLISDGAPVVGTFEFPPSAAGVFPRVYRQTDPDAPGLRLNYEHAFIGGDQTVWALRCGAGGAARGHVLVEYDEDGRGAMAVFDVVDDRGSFPPHTDVEVARQMLPPSPLHDREGYWNVFNAHDPGVCHRDRKLNHWAYRAGANATNSYHYLLSDTFDLDADDQGRVKTSEGVRYLPWAVDGWEWTAVWPKSAPVMKVAQTLTKPVAGLPEVWNMASCDILYPVREDPSRVTTNNVVRLVDPVTAKTAALKIEQSFVSDYGFTVGSSGTTSLRKGKYYFPDLPPSIVERFYVDTNADESRRMVLVGDLVEPAAGNAYLRWNLLSADETAALKALCTREDAAAAWCAAVDELAANGLEDIVARPHEPVSNYALFADGHGAGYVTFIENDSTNTSMVAAGDPINVQVILVTNELHAGTCSTLASKLNKLSELLTVQYNDAYPRMEDDFDLVWYRRDPPEDGGVPAPSEDGSWAKYESGRGKTSFVLGRTGTTLDELVNKYYFLHYQPKEGTPAATTCGRDAFVNTDPALAEGWVQRVLNAVTPFAQRVEDFYSCPSDIAYTMFEQIGRPYQGDVALNNDNLAEVGLIELYRTVFNKAWKMSLDIGVSNTGVNKQLLLAASRLADLYQLLGAEAYADAKNPLISQGFNDTYLAELQNLPGSTFCFQNQVRTLLDEELALLRGRAIGNAPNMTTQPCFNRLYWNFTKGITEGEVAYVNNYGIRADQGVLTIDQAARQYPQGHGDAWGHYLSSIQLYYRLLANPNFDWYATMMEMNLSQAVANEDYYDEQKFADSAVKLAQIGLDATDLTARQAWRDRGGDMRGGYADANAEQAFGYGDWAKRAMLGGVYNWAFVNALLPEAASTDGLKHIDRATVTQLDELCLLVDQIRQKVNAVDSGLNPLGLSQNAVPMDIDPDALEAKNAHFDQILERAERALANCEAVLDFANRYGARLQQIQNAETTAGTALENSEAEFDKQLIAIYGTPYPGDIGPAGTYAQGYEGPDLYHYMWMNLDEFGLSEAALRAGAREYVATFRLWRKDGIINQGGTISSGIDDVTKPWGGDLRVKYSVAANGIVLPTVDNPGIRATEGSIQSAYRDYLTAVVNLGSAQSGYEAAESGLADNIKRAIDLYNGKYNLKVAREAINDALKVATGVIKLISGIKKTTGVSSEVATAVANQMESIAPAVVVGLANGTDVSRQVAAAMAANVMSFRIATATTSLWADNTTLGLEAAQTVADIIFEGLELDHALEEARESLAGTIKGYISTYNDSIGAYRDAIFALQKAEAAYRAEIAKGETLQAERERIRKQQSNTATQYRYADMYNRVQRNNALTKYSTAFDVAQRYVWELAKVYDYETGLLSSDSQAGGRFLAEIVGARQLGWPGVSTSQATDKGLYDIVHRMKENWANLKTRLGVNNPANTATEFSLRYELFRIRTDATGDGAWREELRRHWVDDLMQNPDYRRFCQPLVSTAGPVAREPGLVIPFSTAINNAENFFGKTLQGGDHAYSSADYATKIHSVGVAFDGYDALAAQTAAGLAADPNVYLVPVGRDLMRAPTGGSSPAVLAWNVVDQVLPLPYPVGSTQLDAPDWFATFSGLDGTTDSAARIRRHSTFRANGKTYATRLVGRSVWNDRWILVIPASSLNANREAGLAAFIDGVKDVKLKVQAYSRSGN